MHYQNHNEISPHTGQNGYRQKEHNTNVGKDVEKREPSHTVGRNVNWCSHYGTVWRFLKILTTEITCDPAIPLLGIYSKKKN